MDNNSFNQYKFLILQDLSELKAQQKELHAYIYKHMEEEEKNIQEIRERLIKIEHDNRWVFKVWAGGLSAAGAAVSMIFAYLTSK